MHGRKLLAVLVVVGMLVPAASAAPSLQTVDAPTPNQQEGATTTGYVDLAGTDEAPGDTPLADRGSQRTFTSRLDDPATGDWSLRIMPENAIQFSYEIVRDEG